MIQRIHLITALLLLAHLLCNRGFGQLPDYHIQLFDESHGVRTDMDRVIKDHHGFVWLMYHDRVQRFDGKHVDEFFVGDGLNSIFCDQNGKVWLTSINHVYRFQNDKEGFTRINVHSAEKLTLGNVFQLPGKEVWVLANLGFYAYDQKKSEFLPVTDEGYKTKTPVNTRTHSFKLFENTFFYSSKDTIWSHDVVTGNKLHFPFRNLSGLYAMNKFQLIVSSWESHTYLYDYQKQTIERIIPHKFLKNIEDDFLVVNSALNLDEQRHLLATTKGLLEFNSASGEFALKKLFFKGQPIANAAGITDLHLDDQQKVWACSEYTLMTFDPLGAVIGLIRSTETDPTKSFSNQIRAIAADENENLWLASYNGIIFWDLQKNRFQPFYAVEGATDRMNHPSIRGIEYDGKNVIIGQTNKGIWLYHPVKKKYRRPVYEAGEPGESTRRKLESDFIDQIYKLHNGNHIIAGRDAGYVMEAGTYRIRQIDFPGSKENLNFCYEDRFRQVWLSTYEGLYCLDSNLVYKFDIKEGLGAGTMLCLYQWDDNEYILGAQGLFRIRIMNDEIQTSTLDHFFDQTYIRSIFRDKENRLWLGSDEGLFLFDRKNGYVELFDRFDNVQGDIFYPNCHYLKSDGVLFMGGTNGINYFQPDHMQIRKDSLQVSLMKVTVNENDTSYYYREALQSLKPSQNSIEIEYIAPFYGNTNRLQYRYQLRGLNTEWENVGNNSTIRFTSLPPGNYLFRVAASINGIDWFESEESLPFNIAYPFWRKWWFVLCCMLVLAGLIFYFVRKRVRVIQEKEKIKRDYERRIAEVEMHALRAQMNPHFMFNSLNSINNFILKNDPDNASGYLTKFSRLMRLILDNSRSEWVLLENELKALELYIELEVVRFDHVFEYEIDVAPDISLGTTSIPPMLIQPYVENAIWHGLLHLKQPGGKLCIRLWRAEGQLHISIEDNGVGREEARRLKSKSATKQKSHGMKITAERIEIVNRVYNVNASVEIKDLPGENGSVGGTRVSLTLQDKIYDSHHRG
ncbi:MAG TPA: histidine kinase [Saprospiraceae bacterium]|nr:histidine kinase [Saprospiraceae bacterium]